MAVAAPSPPSAIDATDEVTPVKAAFDLVPKVCTVVVCFLAAVPTLLSPATALVASARTSILRIAEPAISGASLPG